MITLRPRDAIIGELGSYPNCWQLPAWFVLYEQFARRLDEWMPNGYGCEVLNNTTSVHNYDLTPLTSRSDARLNLAKLFAHVGNEYQAADFLRHCGIKAWKDLDTPITLKGWQPKRFAAKGWFDVAGRVLKESPNEYHLDAIHIFAAELTFCRHFHRWHFRLGYSYPHDSSSWRVGIEQRSGEGREHFAKRVDEWMEEILVPEGFWGPQNRNRREWEWGQIRDAVEVLFSNHTRAHAGALLAEALLAMKDKGGRSQQIYLDKARLRILRRWAKAGR